MAKTVVCYMPNDTEGKRFINFTVTFQQRKLSKRQEVFRKADNVQLAILIQKEVNLAVYE